MAYFRFGLVGYELHYGIAVGKRIPFSATVTHIGLLDCYLRYPTGGFSLTAEPVGITMAEPPLCLS